MVKQKSGTSFDRDTKRRTGITLSLALACYVKLHQRSSTYVKKPTATQTIPTVQPRVLSPRTVLQSSR